MIEDFEDEVEDGFDFDNLEDLSDEGIVPSSPKKDDSRGATGVNRKLQIENKDLKEEIQKLKDEKALNSEKSLDVYSQTNKSIGKLSKDLEEIEYSLGNFTRFQERIKTFKVWNTVVYSISGLVAGLLISYLSVDSLYEYRINEKLNEYSAVGKSVTDAGFLVSDGNENIQIYTKKSGKMFKSGEFSVIQVQVKK